MRTIKRILFFLAIIAPLCITYGCGKAGFADTISLSEGIPIELADTPSENGPTIVQNTKVETSAGPVEDTDHDSIVDENDNCPTVSNADQADQDGDGLGDACANF